MSNSSNSTEAGARGRRGLLAIDLAGVMLCLVLLGAWYMLRVEPLREARAHRNALVAELEPRLVKLDALHAQSSAQQSTLNSVGQQIVQGELQLRPVDQINQRLAALTSAARNHGLRLDEVKPGAPRAMQWFMTVPLRITGSGEYPQISDFLHRLPSRFPDVAVVGFEVREEPEAIDKTPRFVLNLVWYAAPRPGMGQN
jgi:Tfp pilus assembly protein PilO